MEILSKITLKTIGCQPKPNKVTAASPLATIYGMATDYKIGTSNFGEFTKFKGDFRAVRIVDGEEFRSGSLLLPPTLADMLRVAVSQAKDTGVQFAVELGVKPSDVPIGYEYSVRPLVNTDQADPLAALAEQVRKALPAPKAEKDDKPHKGGKK